MPAGKHFDEWRLLSAGAPGTGLPLNRKERFYTGTVLPMIVGGENFRYLPRFLRLCGLDIEPQGRLQFFTEYSFSESLFTDADRGRFHAAPTTADTPDVVLAGEDWLLAVEAKMFHNPTADALNKQIDAQRRIVDYLADSFTLQAARVRHVLLLPNKFRPGALDAAVVTWEQVRDEYRDVAPSYWTDVLSQALNRYDDLVSKTAAWGANADAAMTGADILAAHADGTLEYSYMGRQDGLHGARMRDDLNTGRWRIQRYEVRQQPRIATNWFPISEFITATSTT